MSSFLIPHPPATIEQMEIAVIAWRKAAEHERFRAENNLCCGYSQTAINNAALYEKTAREIEIEIERRKAG